MLNFSRCSFFASVAGIILLGSAARADVICETETLDQVAWKDGQNDWTAAPPIAGVSVDGGSCTLGVKSVGSCRATGTAGQPVLSAFQAPGWIKVRASFHWEGPLPGIYPSLEKRLVWEQNTDGNGGTSTGQVKFDDMPAIGSTGLFVIQSGGVNFGANPVISFVLSASAHSAGYASFYPFWCSGFGQGVYKISAGFFPSGGSGGGLE